MQSSVLTAPITLLQDENERALHILAGKALEKIKYIVRNRCFSNVRFFLCCYVFFWYDYKHLPAIVVSP